MRSSSRVNRKRILFWGLWIALCAALFWKPFVELVLMTRVNDNFSHIILIPFISLWLVFRERDQIFRQISYDFGIPALLVTFAASVCLWTLRSAPTWTMVNTLAAYAFALVLLWTAGFAMLFGRAALKKARFSLLFLFLAVPLPDALLNRVIYFLQQGSADIAELIFNLTGVPALREGFIFHLAHVNIEVAKECSGIRSSMALLILALLVGHLLLHAFWRQAAFLICGLFVMIVKNGVRIATLTILAQYVDPGFLYGKLHHEGGIVFFLLGLLMLLPILWLLQRGENPPSTIIPRASAA